MQKTNSRFSSFSQALLSFGGNVIITSLVITGAIIGLRQAGVLEGLELGAFDQLMRSRPDDRPDPRFLVVGISDSDVQRSGEYPIHDGTLARLLTKLEENEPKVIGVDVLRDVPQGPAQGRVELERVLSQSDRIVTVCKMSGAKNPGVSPAPGIPPERVGIADIPLDPGGTLRRIILISKPEQFQGKLPKQHICNDHTLEIELTSFSLQMAIFYLQQEKNPIELNFEDGALLFAKPLTQDTGNTQPDTAEAEATEAEATEADTAEANPPKLDRSKFEITELKRLTPESGGYAKADTKDYQILINYRSNRNAVKVVSLLDVLENNVSAEDIRDKVVMIGYTSQQAKDDFYTPYSASTADDQKMPGVVVHAQNASQIISAVLDNRPLFWFWPDWQEGLWIFGWTVVGATLAWFIRNPWLLVVTTGLSIVVLIGGSFFLFTQAGWIPLVPPLLGILGSATVVLLLDRYAATIVKTVKGFLKINVEIDEAKKDEEVAAITESDYFLDLQGKIEDLRANKGERKETSTVKRPPAISNNGDGYISEAPALNRNRRTTQVSLDVDYLEMVRERKRQRENPDENTNNLELPDSSGLTQEDFGFIDQIQQRGKQMREGKTRT